VEPQRPYEAAAPHVSAPLAKNNSASAAKAASSERLGMR